MNTPNTHHVPQESAGPVEGCADPCDTLEEFLLSGAFMYQVDAVASRYKAEGAQDNNGNASVSNTLEPVMG